MHVACMISRIKPAGMINYGISNPKMHKNNFDAKIFEIKKYVL